jgi:hypothetical protein
VSGFTSTPLAAKVYPSYGRAASLIEDETLLEPKNSLKMLWERFSTAMNSVVPTSVIVVKNHSHQALTSA